MKAKLHTSYRIKMMLYTILSMVITFCFDFAAIYAFNIFYRKRPQNRELSVIEANGSYVPPAENNMNNYPSIMPSKGGAEAFNYLGVLFYAVLIILSITIFLTVFLLLTRKTVLYLQEISGALEKISEGHFETRVPVRYNDEFSIIADNINCMTMDLEYLKKSEQAAEKKKNELITNVAHDLRTPLTSIIGYLDILNTHPELTEEKKKTYIQIAYNKAEKLKTLIEDLFSFTKLTYGQMPLKFSKIDLVKLLEQEIDEFYPYFTENHLVCELHTDTPAAPVMADSTLLARAFENLISNAIKYGKDGKIVYVDISHDETFVTAAIKNYGLVIPQKDLPLIFDKFYRVEHSREETLGGTGLGLSIAKAIVESHKGIITAQSSLEGTVFKVSLPLISKETNLKG
ncbi:MAG: HAMP domain-containing histidine kinase [Clostridiales bacterium]|nr:HAMP domain-containing histidine kinase [Clostridiales bacterium]MDY3746884.1 HAMP domain-containing sensor histidine kinase [Lachnospiraceae bacterium]